MNLYSLLLLSTVALLLQTSSAVAKKKKSGKNSAKDSFNSKTLKCLVCQAVVDEYKAAINRIDPKKVIDSGTFRIDGNGDRKKNIIPYARSQVHLMEVADKVCDSFEDYAQAKEKATGKPTILRLMTHEGNMSPRFKDVDIVPDDDLNKNLKFYCEGVVEDNEEDFNTLLAEEDMDATVKEEICVNRAKLCKKSAIRDEL